MSSEIWTIKGKNPCAIYIQDGSVKCIIEENKIKNSVDFIKVMFGKKEYKITELENDDIIKNLPHPYYGLSYDKDHIFGLVRNSGLYYELHIHDPNNPKFTTPSKFFKRVAGLIKSGKRVGWFQGRWAVNIGDYETDLNRCIIKRNQFHGEIPVTHMLIKNVMDIIGKSFGCVFGNLNAYNPQQAIDKLKNKKIDVLVIANVIVARKEEDLKV